MKIQQPLGRPCQDAQLWTLEMVSTLRGSLPGGRDVPQPRRAPTWIPKATVCPDFYSHFILMTEKKQKNFWFWLSEFVKLCARAREASRSPKVFISSNSSENLVSQMDRTLRLQESSCSIKWRQHEMWNQPWAHSSLHQRWVMLAESLFFSGFSELSPESTS